MNHGMHIAASGALTSMYRQDVMANNLANVDTAGFKPDIAATRARPAAREEDALWNLPSNALLERLGAGPLLAPNRISTRQGPLETTERDLDLAIEGEGFLVLSTGSGVGEERLRLTRDGRLTLDAAGQLVQATSGLSVLDAQDRPITLSGLGPVTVDPDGLVRQDGAVVARIQLTQVADPGSLIKVGSSLLKPSATAVSSRRQADAQLRQGMLERSGVDPIAAVMGVNNAANAVGSNARMISLFDELLGRAVNTFARIA